jgi:ribosomal protein S8/ribosomal protein S14
MEERFAATLKLAEMPRNSSDRIRNRCEVTGRPRAVYRKLKMSRIALRELGNEGPDSGPREVELVRGTETCHDDPIGDMLTRIRNAQMRNKSKVSTPASKLRARVLDVLKSKATSAAMPDRFRQRQVELEIELKYFDGAPVIREIERVSKPGRRVYVVGQVHLPRSPTASASRSCRRRRA